MTKFKIGDRVNWLGALGKIIDISHGETEDDDTLVVDFDGSVYFFYTDGRYLLEQEPSLQRIS